MPPEQNKAIYRRIMEEVFGRGNIALADQLIAANYVEHETLPGLEPGLEGFKQMVTSFRAAFPDMRGTVEDMVAEGEKVVGRYTMRGTHRGEFMGMAPTGKQVTVTGIDILRFDRGKVVEHWGMADQMSMMQQLGAIPSQR